MELTEKVLDLLAALRLAEADAARINSEICQKNVEEASAGAGICQSLDEIDQLLAEAKATEGAD